MTDAEVTLFDKVKAHMEKSMGRVTNVQAIRVLILYYARREKLGGMDAENQSGLGSKADS